MDRPVKYLLRSASLLAPPTGGELVRAGILALIGMTGDSLLAAIACCFRRRNRPTVRLNLGVNHETKAARILDFDGFGGGRHADGIGLRAKRGRSGHADANRQR